MRGSWNTTQQLDFARRARQPVRYAERLDLLVAGNSSECDDIDIVFDPPPALAGNARHHAVRKSRKAVVLVTAVERFRRRSEPFGDVDRTPPAAIPAEKLAGRGGAQSDDGDHPGQRDAATPGRPYGFVGGPRQRPQREHERER